MSIYESRDYDNHEKVVFINDAASGLKAIIAIHNTVLGPALGGCRMWPYQTEQDAITDVLRLSRGMTYKAAMVGVPLGGGKSVIIGDALQDKTEKLLHAMGRAIDSLGGGYIVGEDIGTNPSDMKEFKKETRHVTCLRVEDGGYGDPAPMTAQGVFQAMRAGLEKAHGTDNLSGVHIAVQGVGNVGFNLCKLLSTAGADISVCDVRPENSQRAADEFGATVVSANDIFGLECEIFSPCAMGAILNDDTIPQLRARVIAGAANNQLAEQRHGQVLSDAGIVYLPDYVANGGGLISCAAEYYQQDRDAVEVNVLKIHNTCCEILDYSESHGIGSHEASDRLAESRIQLKH